MKRVLQFTIMICIGFFSVSVNAADWSTLVATVTDLKFVEAGDTAPPAEQRALAMSFSKASAPDDGWVAIAKRPARHQDYNQMNTTPASDSVTLDIKVNASDGPVTISEGDPVSITISLDPGGYAGRNVDWWIVALTSAGEWKSLTITPEHIGWVGWVDGIERFIAAPLVDFDTIEIPSPPLLPGQNFVAFALDDNDDGRLDVTWLDFVQIDQDPAACTFGISPTSGSFGAGGGSKSVSVTTSNSSCTWETTNSLSWVSLSPTSGTGSRSVIVSVDANTGAARSGSVTIAGKTYSISQDGISCTYEISPTSGSFGAGVGSESIAVTASDSNCEWTASSNLSWASVAPTSGTGSQNVNVIVNANTGDARDGEVTIAGKTYSISQDAVSCTYEISPTSGSFGAGGGSESVSVTASNSNCEWTASSNLSWASVSPTSGTGSQSVTVTVDPNTGDARDGEVTIAGKTYGISQDAPSCTFDISPTSGSFGAGGGSESVSVTASNSSCTWETTNSLSWVSLSPTSGTGSQSVTVTVDANTGAARSGSVSIAGKTYSISQDDPSPGDLWTDPITGMAFVWVPGGCYMMGCGSWTDNCRVNEKPVHEVCLDGFWIGKYEVTQGQWTEIMDSNPSHFTSGDNYPVERVNWNDVQGFITALNSRGSSTFRLPTEAEWEYAARSGGREEKYAGGVDLDSLGWYLGNSDSRTHEVGTRTANGLGIHDMTGNVWEWVSDWYGATYYSESPRDNPQGPSTGSSRVGRGGSWNITAQSSRAAIRYNSTPGSRNINVGFRLAFSPGQQ